MSTKFPDLAAVPPTATRFTGLIRTADDPAVRDYIDVPSLTLEVRKFAALQIATSTRDVAPRIMVIAGPPGAGKSQGALKAALSCGYDVATVSCSLFASDVEGGATNTLNAMLEEFKGHSAQHGKRVLAIFDDFDLSIVARDDKTGVSSNTNLLTERLQYLADNRHVYRNADGTNLAFIFTINNAEPLRASLLRDMRATWVEHDPCKVTKANIAFHILDPQTAQERTLVKKLIRRHINQPLAFWKALRLDLDAARLDHLLSNGMPAAHVIDAAMAQRAPIDGTVLMRAAQKRSGTRIRNYLFARR